MPCLPDCLSVNHAETKRMRSQTHSDLGSANDGHKHAKRSQKNSNLAIALTVTHQYGIERTSALRPTRPLLLRNKDDEIPRIWPWGFPQRTAATDASFVSISVSLAVSLGTRLTIYTTLWNAKLSQLRKKGVPSFVSVLSRFSSFYRCKETIQFTCLLL